LLALRAGQPVERAWLIAQLWPDSGESQASHSLRQTLYDLRRALGPAAALLESPTPHTLRLNLDGADGVEVDALAFDADIDAARRSGDDVESLRRAVERYVGPLLADCDETWVLSERELRGQGYLEALERLASAALAQKEYEAAVRYLRRVLVVEPLRESTHRTLLRALAAGGNFAAALVQYRDLRLLLQRELSAEPDPETIQLFEELRARRPSFYGTAAATVGTAAPDLLPARAADGTDRP
jgi:DNA-binding SARP family transcriptional activator